MDHEVIVFHLWDPWERDLPLEGHCWFHDLETGEMLLYLAMSRILLRRLTSKKER